MINKISDSKEMADRILSHQLEKRKRVERKKTFSGKRQQRTDRMSRLPQVLQQKVRQYLDIKDNANLAQTNTIQRNERAQEIDQLAATCRVDTKQPLAYPRTREYRRCYMTAQGNCDVPKSYEDFSDTASYGNDLDLVGFWFFDDLAGDLANHLGPFKDETRSLQGYELMFDYLCRLNEYRFYVLYLAIAVEGLWQYKTSLSQFRVTTQNLGDDHEQYLRITPAEHFEARWDAYGESAQAVVLADNPHYIQ
jgi:hypothetical protein